MKRRFQLPWQDDRPSIDDGGWELPAPAPAQDEPEPDPEDRNPLRIYEEPAGDYGKDR